MMNPLKWIGFGILILIGVVLTTPWWLPVYQRLFQTDEIRYRLTVTVDDNGKLVEGSSVIAAYYVGVMPFYLREPITGRRIASGFQGESVVVDLGKKGQIFTVLRWGAHEAFSKALGVSGDWRQILADIRHLKRSGGSAEVPENLRPMFVTFDDRNIPKSVKEVDPKDFNSFFGEGVALKNMTVTVVDSTTPVTKQIISWLPWLPKYYSMRLDGERYGNAYSENKFANTLASGNFKVGEL